MLKSKSLLDYTNSFSPSKFEEKDRMILRHFQYLKKLRWENRLPYLRQLKEIQNPYGINHFRKNLNPFPIIYSKHGNGDEKTFKEKESNEILKIIGLIKNI